MPITSWEEYYAVDVSLIDQQHRQMIDILNDACAAAIEGRSARQVSGIVSELVKVVSHHFRDEEELMQAGIWPASDQHKQQHVEMLNLLRDIELDLQLGRIQPATALIRLLMDKLVGHTARETHEYQRRERR